MNRLRSAIATLFRSRKDARWRLGSELRILEMLQERFDNGVDSEVLVFHGKDKQRLFGSSGYMLTVDLFECDFDTIPCTVAQWATRGKVLVLPRDHPWIRYTAIGMRREKSKNLLDKGWLI